MDELLEEYHEMFEESFPLMLTRGMGEKEIIKILKECIKTNQEYDPILSLDADY